MKKPLFTKENVLIIFELGLVVLKSMKDIYETKTEERICTNDTEINIGDSKKDSNSSDRVTDP